MRLSKYLKVSLVLSAFLMLLSGCSKSIEQRLEEFYLENKDNPDLLIFGDVSIFPQRGLVVIKLWDYGGVLFRVASFDESSDPQIVLNSGTDNFEQLHDEYNLDQEAVMRHLSNLLSTYNDLGVLAVFGTVDGMYIRLVVDHNNVVVFVPDRKRLTEGVLKELTKLEKRAERRFDEHWFTYKPDKPYDFGG